MSRFGSKLVLVSARLSARLSVCLSVCLSASPPPFLHCSSIGKLHDPRLAHVVFTSLEARSSSKGADVFEWPYKLCAWKQRNTLVNW